MPRPRRGRDPPTTYNPREAFAPFAVDPQPSAYRSASGVPGPAYWQNRANYVIRATLDPASHSISGTIQIRYTNNSPDTLDVLWLQLEQNLYRPESRGYLSVGGRHGAMGLAGVPHGFTQGMILDSVQVGDRGRTVAVKPLVNDTRAQVRLPTPLAPGATAMLADRYHYTDPEGAVGRPQRLDG